MAETYLDIVIKRQAILERLKTAQVKDFAKEISKVDALIRSTLLGLDIETGELSRTKLNSLLSSLQADQGAIFKAATSTFTNSLADVSILYASQEVIDLTKTVDLRGTRLNKFTKKEVFKKVIERPLSVDGDLLEPWIKDFSTKEVRRVNNTIRAGWTQGKTNQDLVRELVGTKARNYRDGVLETSRRNASTVVRTSVQHAASSARQEIWEANKDVAPKYKFIATLDGVTSSQCRGLDGQTFEHGKGPLPPIHPNCRSTTIAVLADKFSFLSEGRTRSAEDGPTSADSNYYDWLKRQPQSVQDDVLGPRRSKLFRDGGMTAEKFRKLQFDKNFEPLTLAEMRRLEPEAFEKAGL